MPLRSRACLRCRLRARHLEGGKHTERNGITTRDLVTRCLAETSRLQRSICLPTRWKGCSPFRILLVLLSEGSSLRSHSARKVRCLARPALDRLPPKANATDFGLTPHHTSTLTEAACWTADFRTYQRTARKYAATFSSERFVSIWTTRVAACRGECRYADATVRNPYATQQTRTMTLNFTETRGV